MCRLFGFSYNENDEALAPSEIAQIVLPLLTRGGPHSYGWLTTDGTKESKVTVAKFAGRADTLLAKTRMEEIDPAARVFIAHTRWATHGSPLNLNNDHPLRHGNIVGVHNGVLRNHHSILKVTGRQLKDTQVDSEAIFAAVNRWGHKKGLSKIDGDMVAVYTDLRKPHIVSIARSHGRPCVLGKTAKGNLFWASEKRFLEALEPHGIEFVWFSGIRDYRLVTIRKGSIINRLTYMTPPKPEPIPARLTPHPRAQISTGVRRRSTGVGRVSAMNEYFDAIKKGKNPEKYRSEAVAEMRARAAESATIEDIVESPVPFDNSLYYDAESGLYLTAGEMADEIRRREGWS